MSTSTNPLNTTAWPVGTNEPSWKAMGLADRISVWAQSTVSEWRRKRNAYANLQMMSARDAADIGTTIDQLQFDHYYRD